MRRTMEEDASKLADVLCFGPSSDITATLEAMGDEELYEACTTIMASGHTTVHMLAQRQKVTSLQAVLKRGVDVNTRNAQGTTPIHLALQHNALSSAKILIDHGASVSEIISRRKGTSLLHMLVMCDRPLAVRLLLAEGAAVDCRDHQERTPLHLAAIYGNLRIADILMQHDSCNANILDGTGHTPLMLAILNNNADLARHLAAATKTDVSLKDRDGMSALHLAVAFGQVDVTRSILNRNTANINSKERRMGRTPLHFACTLTANSHEAAVLGDDFARTDQVWRTNDVNRNGYVSSVNTRTADSDNASNHIPDKAVEDNTVDGKVAVDNGNASSEDSLVTRENNNGEASTNQSSATQVTQNGADVKRGVVLSTSTKGQSKKLKQSSDTRNVGISNGSVNKSQEITRAKTPRNGLRDRNGSFHKDLTSPPPGKEPVHCKPGSRLRLGASLAPPHHERTRANTDNHTFRRPATASSRLSSARSSSAHTRRGISPILTIASLHHTLSGRKESMSVNSHNRRDSTVSFVLTPSNVGAVRGKLVSLLLEHCADANLMTQFRKSALHMVAMLGDTNVMALLLPHTTNLNMLSASNKTALHLAVEGGHASIVSHLIHAGANVGLRDMLGMTALHMAAKLGHADMVTMLLAGGAKKDNSDFKQMTPLHHACQNGHSDVIDLLLKAGCRTDLVDDQGVPALDYRENCIAEKDETEKPKEPGAKPRRTPDEAKTEPRRQRKKGAVLLTKLSMQTVQ